MDNTKNRAQDLMNIMFSQLERLNNEDLTKEEVEKELMRSKALCDVTEKMTEFTRLQLEYAKANSENEIFKEDAPRLLC